MQFDSAPLRAVTGFVSRTLCSGTFVSGLDSARVYAETIAPMAGMESLNRAIRTEVAKDRGEVRASVFGLFESRSVIKRIAAKIDAQAAVELARIRKKLKLTQLEAARITGGGPNAFSRYERGIARPLPAVTNLFRLLDRHPELLKELRKVTAA